MIKPNSEFITLWRIRTLCLNFVVAFVIELLFSVPLIKWVLIAVWLLFTAALYFYYIPTYYKSCEYHVGGEIIRTKSGVFWSKTQEVATPNIQFYTVENTPVERFLQLKNIHIHLAGGRVHLMALDAAALAQVLACLTHDGAPHE